jgi:prepilin-type N-terminal cleavage/methylation domain-containing protein
MQRANGSGELGRRGFTLIELLVVVSIIAVLLALSAAATIKYIGVQQASNTKTALTKLQSQLDSQWAAVTQRAKDETIPDNIRASIQTSMAGSDPNATARTRVIYVKLKQRQMFPMTFDEAINPSPLPPLKPYVDYLNGLGVNGSAPATQPFESAVCLLMALERAPSGGGVSTETLGIGTNITGFTLPGGQQVNVLVDAWKSPLVFCRWPSGSTELNPNGATAGRNDPGDPQGLLSNPAWANTAGAQTFANFCHPVVAGKSYKLAPMIASAGPDKKLGLDPKTLAELPGPDAKDNLYSTSAR